NAVAVGPPGDDGVYVTGQTFARFPDQPELQGAAAAFVSKRSRADGSEIWTRVIDTAGEDAGLGVATDATGVYVVGLVRGCLPGHASDGSMDAFVGSLRINRAPVVSVPTSVMSEATSGAGAVVAYAVTDSDPDGDATTLNCSPASGSTFPIGTTTVTCTSTDT